MLDLSPEAHTDAHYWASTLLAHATIGLALTAVLGALIRSAWGAAVIVSLAYALGWEVWWQALGAGLADAVVDSAAVTAGAVIAAAAWERKGGAVASALVALAAVLWRGIRRRS